MIVYTSKECTLQIPKGLGNFAADSVDIEPLSGSVIELSATTVTLSGAVETLNKSVDSQGNAIADLLLDVDGLDTRVSGNTKDIAALSAQTTANTAHIEALSASTVAMNNSVTANTANIATLSGITSGLAVSVETLSGEVKEDIYVYLKDLTAMTKEEKTVAWGALEEKYLAGHSIYLVAKSSDPSTDLIFPLTKYQPYTEGDKYTGYFGFSVIEGGGNAFYDVTFWRRGDTLGNIGTRIIRKEMYTLPKASSGMLGGIKVGSGLTMSGDFLNLEIGEGLGFSGNTLVVSGGGSGGGNYLIVDSLSDISNPYEGLEAYVKEKTEYLEYTGYTIDASQISEGYAAHIYYDGTNEKAVYRSGGSFHWGWDNGITDRFIDEEDFYYKINSEHTVFTVLLKNPAAYVTFEGGVTTATTSDTIEIFHMSTTHRYNGTEWEQYQPQRVCYLDEMTKAERVSLYRELKQYYETTFPAGKYRFFAENKQDEAFLGKFEVFLARFDGNGDIWFTGIMQSRYNDILYRRSYQLNSVGDFSITFSWDGQIPTIPEETRINITSGGTLDGDFEKFYNELLGNTNNGGAVIAPFPILFREEIPDSGETYYAGTVEAFTMGHSTQNGNDNWAIFTAKIEWNGRTRVGKWKIWYNEQGWHSQTLYWGWLMNGLVCVYDNEYSNWSQAEKEEWYDRIIEECWNYDNTSFGIIRVNDKTSSADTGYNHMRVSYSIYKLDSIEAGYNSLHFSGSEKDGDGPAERLYNARIMRGNSIEYWEKRVDLSKLDKVYDAFIVAQYDEGNKSLTGITHSTKATMWETYKIERNEGYARKTIVAYVHTGDVVPARFNLIYVDGNMDENESGVKLYFGAVYNSIADSSLHSVRFSLSKNVETDVYTIGDIVEYSYANS